MAKKETSAAPATPSAGATPSATPTSSAQQVAHEHLSASASTQDYFAVGSLVKCVLCEPHDTVEGEVMAFDPPTRMLVLKCASTSKKAALHNVQFVNLNFCQDLSVLRDGGKDAPSASGGHGTRGGPAGDREPPQLNVGRLHSRARNAVDKKRRSAKAFKTGISPEGQRLFQAIGKTLDDVEWRDKDIIVMEKVVIKPPYDVTSVTGHGEKAISHVRKIVEKYHEDARRTSSNNTNSNANSSHPSSPAVGPGAAPSHSHSPSPAGSASTAPSDTPLPPSSSSATSSSATTPSATPSPSSESAPSSSAAAANDRASSNSSNNNNGLPASNSTTSTKRGGGGGGGGSYKNKAGRGGGAPKPTYAWAGFRRIQ